MEPDGDDLAAQCAATFAKFCTDCDDRQLTERKRATGFRLPAGRRRVGFAVEGAMDLESQPPRPT